MYLPHGGYHSALHNAATDPGIHLWEPDAQDDLELMPRQEEHITLYGRSNQMWLLTFSPDPQASHILETYFHLGRSSLLQSENSSFRSPRL